jgi:hypothetical protein
VCALKGLLQVGQQGERQLDLIEAQIEEADRMLEQAVAGLRGLRAQRDLLPVDGVSFELTNSATAALT